MTIEDLIETYYQVSDRNRLGRINSLVSNHVYDHLYTGFPILLLSLSQVDMTISKVPDSIIFIPSCSYSDIWFTVPAELQHLDPQMFPAEHSLSIHSNDIAEVYVDMRHEALARCATLVTTIATALLSTLEHWSAVDVDVNGM